MAFMLWKETVAALMLAGGLTIEMSIGEINPLPTTITVSGTEDPALAVKELGVTFSASVRAVHPACRTDSTVNTFPMSLIVPAFD